MTDRLLALVALAALAAFLGILLWKVRVLDLGVVTVATFALAAFDFLISMRRS